MGKIGYKWGVHWTLMKDVAVAKTLPETRLFQERDLMQMLQKYGSVILKPSGGTGGYGVIQVTRTASGGFELRWGAKRRILPHGGALIQELKPRLRLGGSRYLIQQRIDLAKVWGRPFDIRVMVQRRKGRPWKVTGHLAKVAAERLIVTNVARQATVLPVETALQRSTVRGKAIHDVMYELKATALHAAKRLGRHSPSSLVAGFDLGVDQRGKVWMIEANPKPCVAIFLHLKDKTMYNRILRYPLGY